MLQPPDLTLCDFFPFLRTKKDSEKKCFNIIKKMKEKSPTEQRAIPTIELEECFAAEKTMA